MSYADVVEYSLVIKKQKLVVAGKEVETLTINNSIPGPPIKAKIGDFLRIKVNNDFDEETSIHWHGVLVPNRMDGVPYITTPPIKPGQLFLYEFKVKQTGTYWYHAHSGLQEQKGVYGPIIFYPKDEIKDYDEEHVLVLSDWTNEDPWRVLANIKKDPDYYAFKKDSVQSWYKVLANGYNAIKLRFNNALNRMTPMDISDVGYDAFLINGKKSLNISNAKPGSRIKLRIINAASSSYFILGYSGGPMKIIEADGMKVEPFTAKNLRIAIAETYNVIITIPKHNSYEFRATAEDGTGYATATFGSGKLIPAPTIPKPNLMLMSHHGHTEHGSMHAMGMGNMDYSYANLKSPVITTFPTDSPARVIVLNLTGSMERYVWTINDKPMYAADKILIKKGENIRFVLTNNTMMHHPIHLHGHFFRVLNGQGDYSPLKHTVNVAPFETVEIEFYANEDKDWLLHCHNLYHMILGMGRIVHYEGTESDRDVMSHSGKHEKDHGNIWFNAAKIGSFSNLAIANAKLMRNDDNVVFDARYNYKKDYEGELIYKRYLSQFLGIYAGGDFKHEDEERLNRGIIGFEYTLPLLIKADVRLNIKGNFRLELSNEHQLTDRMSFDWKWNTDKEYILGLNYAITKQLYASGNYDSREQWGAGLVLRF